MTTLLHGPVPDDIQKLVQRDGYVLPFHDNRKKLFCAFLTALSVNFTSDFSRLLLKSFHPTWRRIDGPSESTLDSLVRDELSDAVAAADREKVAFILDQFPGQRHAIDSSHVNQLLRHSPSDVDCLTQQLRGVPMEFDSFGGFLEPTYDHPEYLEYLRVRCGLTHTYFMRRCHLIVRGSPHWIERFVQLFPELNSWPDSRLMNLFMHACEACSIDQYRTLSHLFARLDRSTRIKIARVKGAAEIEQSMDSSCIIM
jgi:hypothetical protein